VFVSIVNAMVSLPITGFGNHEPCPGAIEELRV